MNTLHIPFLLFGVLFFQSISAIPPQFRNPAKSRVLSTPSCNPPETAKQSATWNRCPYDADANAWYGITNQALDYSDAAKQCQIYGGHLFSATDQNFDMCAYHAIDAAMVFDQLVLFSGRYFSGFNSWAWCSEDTCDVPFGYTNWDEASSSVGNCMGGYLQDSSSDGLIYGWAERDCRQTLVRVLCRLDCDEVQPEVTTEEYATTAVVNPKPQSLMYTVEQPNPGASKNGSLYHYNIDEFGNPVKLAVYELPYQATFARITYNYQLSVLEIVGDYYGSYTSNNNHFKMSDAGDFSRVSNSLWSLVKYGSLVYVESVGTLCIGGQADLGETYDDNVYWTQIVTQNTNWPAMNKSDHLLASYNTTRESFDHRLDQNYYRYLAVTTHQNVVYLVGGSGSLSSEPYSSYVQSLNLDSVDNLFDAQTRTWTTLGRLENGVGYATVQYFSEKLYIIGSGPAAKDLQQFDLQTNQTSSYANVYSTGSSSGVEYAGSWISNGNMTIFGGDDAQNCIQQSGNLAELGVYWGDSCDNSIIDGTVIEYYTTSGQEISFVNIFK